jgi:heme exporter protein D
MWNGEKSIILSKLCVLLFLGLLFAVVVTAPWLTNWFVEFSQSSLKGKEAYLMATIYVGSVPAAYLLYSLLKLLRHIEIGQVFTPKNVELLRRISWSCFLGAGIALISLLYYFPWVFLAVAAAFMGLIVRVVKNVVAQAVELKDEADYTV